MKLMIKVSLFEEHKVVIVETTDYKLCCVFSIPENCTSLKPWYINCYTLLPSTSMQISLIVVSVVLGLMNVLSVVVQIFSIRKTKIFQKKNPGARQTGNAFEAVVICVNGCDFLFGAYMCIIWISSLVHKEYFVLKEEWWKGHPICFTAFALALMFSFTSPILLALLSVMRFRVISKPMSTKFKETAFVAQWLTSICISTFILCLLFTLLTNLLHTSLPFNLCLPFIDPTNSLVLLKVLIGLITALEFFSSVSIAVVYCLLVKEKEKTQLQATSNSSSKRDKGMIAQLVIITLSNVLCWLPSSVIYMVSIFLDRFPIDMVIWVTVSVLPINSIVNPIVFVVTTLRKICASK